MMLPGYNYVFDEKTGYFVRWGKTMDDDPQFSPIGPEICDYEVSEICSQGCGMCYKSNTKTGRNTSFEEFKATIDKMPSVLQVAFGIGNLPSPVYLRRKIDKNADL